MHTVKYLGIKNHVFKQTKVGSKLQSFSYKLTYLFFDIFAWPFNTFSLGKTSLRMLSMKISGVLCSPTSKIISLYHSR